MNIKVYTIRSFVKTEEGGNPAGIVLDAEGLSEDQMKTIAGIVGFSETAFVMKSSVADHKLRFFTPEAEVGLCGHATIGTWAFLFTRGIFPAGRYTQETEAGLLNIDIAGDGTIMMEQTLPRYYETVDRETIAGSLNIMVEDLAPDLEPQIVSTGLRDVMVPIRSRAVLDAIQPDFESVAEVSKVYETVGYHLFTRDTLWGGTAYCRNLAPLYGIPEESATGTSSGALACYLMEHGQLDPADAGHLVFEQGYAMGKPSEIRVSLEVSGREIQGVRVGGKAGRIREITLEI